MDPICRLCMEASQLNQSMADETILTMVEDCIQIKVDVENDLLPVEICDDCYFKIKDFSEFKENCYSIQDMLRQEIEENRREQDEIDELDLLAGELQCAEVEAIDESMLLDDINLEDLLNDVRNNNGNGSSISAGATEKDESSEASAERREAADDGKTPRKRRKTKRCYREEYISALTACEVCGKMVHKTLIPGHLNMHKGIKPYTCPREGCKSSFHCKHKLKRHLAYKHTDGNFPCDQCEKVLNSGLALYHHKFATHHLRSKTCQKCDKQFSTGHGLKRHMMTHKEERNYKCPHCEMTFGRTTLMEIHMRTHIKDRPYMCTKCDAGYNHKRLLNNHIKRKHPVSENALGTINANELASLIST